MILGNPTASSVRAKRAVDRLRSRLAQRDDAATRFGVLGHAPGGQHARRRAVDEVVGREPGLERRGEGDDLPGGAGLPARVEGGDVVLAGLEPGAADHRLDLTVLGVHGDEGSGEPGRGAQVVVDHVLRFVLHRRVLGRVDLQPTRQEGVLPLLRGAAQRGVDRVVDQAALDLGDPGVRRPEVGRRHDGREGRHVGLVGLGLGDVVLGDHPAEGERPAVLGALRVAERVVTRRVVDEPGEQGRLRDVDLAQLGLRDAAERRRRVRRQKVPLDRRLHPVGALPEVHGVQVLLEDLLLRVLLVEPQGEDDLLHLAVHRPGRVEDALLDELLGDRRAALEDLTGRGVGDRGPEDAVEVDAVVGPEGVVLDGDDGVLEEHGHLVQGDVLAVLGPEHPDDVPVGVVDRGALVELAELPDRVALVRVGLREDGRPREQRREARPDGDAPDEDRREQPARNRSEPMHAPSRLAQRPPNSALAPPRRAPGTGVTARR